MSNVIYANGKLELTVPASSKLAVFSRDGYKVYQKIGYPNEPDSWSLIKAGAPYEEYRSAAFAAAAVVRIEGGADVTLYALGADAVILERKMSKFQDDPVAVDVTGAVSAAAILGGIVTSSTAAAVAGTVPTGTVMDASCRMAVGEYVDWSVINTGAANAFTVTAAADHTIVGAAAVALSTSGRFRTRKTAANTFVTYRI